MRRRRGRAVDLPEPAALEELERLDEAVRLSERSAGRNRRMLRRRLGEVVEMARSEAYEVGMTNAARIALNRVQAVADALMIEMEPVQARLARGIARRMKLALRDVFRPYGLHLATVDITEAALASVRRTAEEEDREDDRGIVEKIREARGFSAVRVPTGSSSEVSK